MTKTIKLYHGTNRNFKEHKLEKSRTILNDGYQGDWLCYTDNLDVAKKYSEAARNQNIDNELFLAELPNVLSNLSDDSVAIDFITRLTNNIIEHEYTIAWEKTFDSFLGKISNREIISRTEAIFSRIPTTKKHSESISINDYCDLLENLEYVFQEPNIDSSEALINMFNGTINCISTGTIDFMKRLGFKDSIPEPKIYVSEISYEKKLDTSDKLEAKNAKKNGFDLVFFHGEGTVDDVPEYLVSNSNQIKILKVINLNKKQEKNKLSY